MYVELIYVAVYSLIMDTASFSKLQPSELDLYYYYFTWCLG